MDFLHELIESASARVKSGYYDVPDRGLKVTSLVSALKKSRRVPIIAELKLKSPVEGRLGSEARLHDQALAYERGGAAAISVLTEPEHFDGRLEYVSAVKESVRIPILMKDVIVSKEQIEGARRTGADAVLLISDVFSRNEADASLSDTIKSAHAVGLEVLLETHGVDEYRTAFDTQADLVGINNRDLSTLDVDLDTSSRLLSSRPHPKPVICESGITSRRDVDLLLRLGADGFLIGSFLMKSGDPAGALSSLTEAIKA